MTLSNLFAVICMIATLVSAEAGTKNPDPNGSKGDSGAMFGYIVALLLTGFVLGAIFVCYRLNQSDDGSDDEDDKYEKK